MTLLGLPEDDDGLFLIKVKEKNVFSVGLWFRVKILYNLESRNVT